VIHPNSEARTVVSAAPLVNHRFHRLFDVSSAVVARMEELGNDGTVVAVDAGGRLVVVLRTDHAPFITLEPARRKAITAASMRVSTRNVAEMMTDPLAAEALRSMGDALAVPGGFPVFLAGHCIGGIGIAAGHYNEDQAIGEYVLFAEDRQQ
jgi:uncharacterized protein GlcG (DUF336 family)